MSETSTGAPALRPVVNAECWPIVPPLDGCDQARFAQAGLNVAGLRLRRFACGDEDVIAGWVRDETELLWLAPSAEPPLTPAKVRDWPRPNGHALVLSTATGGEPLGYGELNPMRGTRDHHWLGHVVVKRELRGCGLGRLFVEALVGWAYAQLGLVQLSLVVFPANKPAISCYRRCGFRGVADEFHHFPGREKRYRMLRMSLTGLPD